MYKQSFQAISDTLNIKTFSLFTVPYLFLNFNNYIWLPIDVSRNCCMDGKQCWSWSDIAEYGI